MDNNNNIQFLDMDTRVKYLYELCKFTYFYLKLYFLDFEEKKDLHQGL